MVRFHPSIAAATLTQLRMECQVKGGFLTILNAPIALKQQLDVWGYSKDALPIMQRLKAQFDPANRLNPNRFVGGI
jgi:glycolate oxidase FAD binding subunit